MAGKFLKRGAIVDVIESEERTNAAQKREGLSAHPIRFTTCGCPDENCGGWHTIELDRTVPSATDCTEIIRADNKVRKSHRRAGPNNNSFKPKPLRGSA